MKSNHIWYQSNLIIIASLILFFPAGLFLMWKNSRWSNKIKWIITSFFCLLILINGITNNSKSLTSNQSINKTSPAISKLSKKVEEKITPIKELESKPQNNLPTKSQILKTFMVTRVIDGDTIEIEGGQRIRYIGIDTPETVDPRKPVQCFGKEASNKNKELVENKRVRLEKDVSETDKYGRLLRYIYVDNLFVNDYLVRQGYAHASSYPPDIKYQNLLTQAEKEAKSNSLGLWGETCQTTSTQTSQNTNSSQQQTADCIVKGNISSSGEKIYHMPGQRFYEKTNIDTGKGERLFCSESEAVSAGWRRSKI